MKINLCNRFHNGDIHYSRMMALDLISQDHEVIYYHENNHKILSDIPGLTQFGIHGTEAMNHLKEKQFNVDGELFLNTWVGNIHTDGPICFKKNYELIKELYSIIGIEPKGLDYYIPQYDYSLIDRGSIDHFCDGKRVVLVCNHPVSSGQSLNFEFEFIEGLQKEYPQYTFVTTKKTHGIVCMKDIIDVPCDLIECSYFSTKAEVIIGRASGAFCFSHVRENLSSVFKRYVTLSYSPYDGMEHEFFSGINLWTNNFERDNVIMTIKDVL